MGDPRRSEPRAAAGLALAAVSALSCGDDAVLVVVTGELEAPAEVDSLCLAVADPGASGEGGAFAQRYDLAGRELPQSLAVEPGRAEAAVATARGYRAGLEVARAQGEFDFSSGELALELDLCGPGDLGEPALRELGVGAEVAALSRSHAGDLVVAFGAGEVVAYRRGGAPAEEIEFPAPPADPSAVAAADLTANCEDDLVFASERGLEVWTREGPAFSPGGEAALPSADELRAVATGDFLGTGTLDVAVGGGETLALYEHDGSGGLAEIEGAVPAGAVSDVTALVAEDFTGSGTLDLLVGQGADEPAPLVLLEGSADSPGALTPAAGGTPDVDYRIRGLAARSGDSRPADAVAAAEGGILHLFNRGDGRLDDRGGATLPGGGDASAVRDVAFGDWQGACRRDVIVSAGGEVRLWRAGDEGGFRDEGAMGAGGGRLILDDLGGASGRDLVVAGSDGVVWIER